MDRSNLYKEACADFGSGFSNTKDERTSYIDVLYDLLYTFDSLVTGSTIEYEDFKHDAILEMAETVYHEMYEEVTI